ncbi:acetylxylan esterase [Algoriphagus sp. H41]|uniref:Acetylxylan esterase n=1 Tax=Algoriphagus oliviformis TaxID=2811231 RepID=A0ABS3C5I7_9BACT|nr:acetylxylan esterase [Algoriphagus oliviformis]MBN7812377.1 acetylxylan esterase [Algoriphagus oliviformis]
MTKLKYLAIALFLTVHLPTLAQRAIHYEESQVPDLVLPDVLVGYDGSLVNRPGDWEYRRRPELVAKFADQVYGQLPRDFDQIAFRTAALPEHPHAAHARLKEVLIDVSRNGKTLMMKVKLYLPKDAVKPVPVFVLISHRKVEEVTGDVANRFFPVEQITGRGYAAAIFDVEFVSPDDPERYSQGIIDQLYPEQKRLPNGMKGLSAWAWGAMRVMDYLEMDPEVDASRAAVVGHSRGGKAALWTGANDTRWAITISNESGCGGAALSKRRFGETVHRINTGFPYWFSDNFKKYNDKEEDLPLDQHQLLASIAPRALYVGSSKDDRWADPRGEFLSLQLGSRVYSEVYGISLEFPENFELEVQTIHQDYVGYHLREGKHDLTDYDWGKFLDFADRQYGLK